MTSEDKRAWIVGTLFVAAISAMVMAHYWSTDPCPPQRPLTRCEIARDAAYATAIKRILNFDNPNWDKDLIAYWDRHKHDC